MTEVIVNPNTSIVEVINEPIVIEIGGFGSSSGGGIGTIANVGSGTGVFKQIASGTAQFKTLLAGSNITLTPAADTITISATNASLAALLTASNDADGNTITNLGAPSNPTDAARLQDIPTSLAPSGAAGGDLSGTYPNPVLATVIGLTPGAYGSATHYPTLSVDSKGRVTIASQLALPTSLPPSGSAGGDLTGTYPNPTINNTAVTYAKIQNVTANRLLGRVSTTGSVQEIQLGAGLEFDGTTLQVNEFDPLGWLTGGNSVSEVKTIGTTTPFDFPLIANNVEVMRIKASGLVNFTGVSQDDLLTKILTIDSSGDLYWRDVASISSSALTSFSDSAFEVYNDVDVTKTIALNLSGINTATTRTYTAPNASGVLALTTNVNGVVEMNEINGSLITSQLTDSAVTYPKIQNVSAHSFLANITGSPTVVQEVATNRIPLFGSAITGTPSATTYLRGDGTWATPASSVSSFEDSVFEIYGSSDATKIAKFEVDGFTTATTRTFTLPDNDGTVALTSDLSGWLTGTLTNNVSLIGGDTYSLSFGTTGVGQRLSTFALTSLAYSNINFLGGGAITSPNESLLVGASGVSGELTLVGGIVNINTNSIQRFSIDNNGAVQLNLGSDATGDTYYRNSSGYLTRLAKGAEGTLLRAGASVPAYSTFTIPNTISALSAFVANSANVLTTVTPAAGQSIRVNAGGTAWEAYTPSAGVSDGDKGDITVSGSGATWTIDSTAVTYAKIQNVAANSFLANATGSSATVQEIATSRIPLFGSAITGTPSANTFLRGDGTWSNSLTRNVSNSANIFSLRNSSTGSNAVTTISIGNNSSGETFKIGITGSNYTNTEYDNSPANATNLFTKTASPIRIGTNDTLRYTISETGDHLFNGTLSVTGDVTATGAVTGSNLSGTNTGDQTLSDITAATGANTINSGANHQIWDWNSLTSGTGMSFRSSSTGADSNTLQVVSIEKSGANSTSSQTTTALNVSNTSTGTSATNIAGRFTASGGTNNYALDIVGGINWSNGANLSTWTQTHTGTQPGINLVTNRNAAVSQFGIQNINGGASAETRFRLAGSGQIGWLAMAGANNTSAYGEGYRMALWNSANAGIIFGTNNTGRAVFTNDNKFVFGATTITSGSVLADFQSTTSGVLVPRVTNTAAISTPVNGMVAYDSATNEFIFRQNSSWTGLGIGGSIADNQVAFGSGTDIAGSNNLTWDGSILQNSSIMARIQSIRAHNSIQNSAFFGNTSSAGSAAGVVTVRNNTSTDAFRIVVTSSGYSNTIFESPGGNAVNLWSVLNGPMRFGTNDTLRYTITANGEHLYPASSYLNMGTTAGSDGYGIRDNAGTMQYKHSGGSWVNMNIASQLYTSGTSILMTVGGQSSEFVSTTVNSNPVHGMLFGNQASGPSVGGLISVAKNGTGTSLGANLYYIAGTSGGVDNRGGSHYFDPGDGSGYANSGNVAFMTTSVSNWQGMGRGIAIGNADTEPIAGLVDCNALYSFDFEGTSELFAYNEEGGKVGITFVEPIITSSTSITLSETHRGKVIYCTSGSAVTVTVDELKVGFMCQVVQKGAGTVTLNAGSDVVLEGKTATTAPHDAIGIHAYWLDSGDTYYQCS